MDIIFSANNNEEVMILPIIPKDMPELSNIYNNTVFETVNGQINLIGNKGLREVMLESFFPVNKNYRYAHSGSNPDGWAYVAFFNKWMDKRVPIRMVWVDDNKEISNMAYTVEKFTTQIARNKDINYTLELKEYRFIKVKKVT